MAILLVTYDLKAPGQDYNAVYEYLKKYTWCKGLESVWLLDTKVSPAQIRDDLNKLIDDNDKTFIVQLKQEWASHKYYCGEWLKRPERDW